MEIRRAEKVKTYTLYALAMLIPCAYLLLWYIIQGHSFLAAKPYFSDEIGYWRRLFSVDNCGFDFGAGGGFAGYKAPVGPLGSHGLSPVFAWGWYALLFPWRDNSIFAANFIMLTASIAAYILLLKPDRKTMMLTIALLLIYAPAALYINTAMMEIPCIAAMIVYSALYIRWRNTHGKCVFAAAIAMGVYLGVLRICYVIVLLPLLWERWDFGADMKTIAKLACYAAGCLLLYKVCALFMTPYPDGFAALLGRTPLAHKPAVLLRHTLSNLKIYFRGCFALSAEAAFRWQYLAALAYFLYKAAAKGERRPISASLPFMRRCLGPISRFTMCSTGATTGCFHPRSFLRCCLSYRMLRAEKPQSRRFTPLKRRRCASRCAPLFLRVRSCMRRGLTRRRITRPHLPEYSAVRSQA